MLTILAIQKPMPKSRGEGKRNNQNTQTAIAPKQKLMFAKIFFCAKSNMFFFFGIFILNFFMRVFFSIFQSSFQYLKITTSQIKLNTPKQPP